MAEVKITFQDINVNGKVVKIITFAGQLDETNVDEEAKKIYQVIDEVAEPNLLLDFSQLSYMNSKSIGYLTDWYSRVSAKNGKITIASPRPNILDILKVVGITQIITIHENLDEAKLVFSGAADDTATEAPATAPAETPVVAETAPAAPAPAEPTPEATPPAPAEPVADSEPVVDSEPVEPAADSEPVEPETPAETPPPATPPAAPGA